MRLRLAVAAAVALNASPAIGQDAVVAPPVPDAATRQLLVPAGTMIDLVTSSALSSKKNVKGDLLYLKVATPVIADGIVAIPEGTVVVAQLSRAIDRGAFGRSGKLDVQLLYAELPSGPLRVSGTLGARGKSSADDAAATALSFLALPFIATGRSAEIPAGSAVAGRLDVDLRIERR